MEKQHKLESSQQKSIIYSLNESNFLQMGQLQREIVTLSQQNKKKYTEIEQQKHNFNYQLYRVNEFQSLNKAFGKQLLLKQLDKLLDQKNYLDRELQHIKFCQEERINQKEQMLANQSTHFQLLRSIWQQANALHKNDSIQHIEGLNLMVGQLRSNVNSLIRFQQNTCKQYQESYLKTIKILHQKGQECKKCYKSQEQLIILKENIKQLERKLAKKNGEDTALLAELSNKEQEIKKLNKNLLKQQAQFKSKILQLEQQILKKDQALRLIKKQMNVNRLTNLTQDYELIFRSSSHKINFLSQQINIPFQKLLDFLTNKDQFTNQFKIIPFQQNRSTIIQNQSIQIPNLEISNNFSLEKIKRQASNRPKSDRMRGLLGVQAMKKLQKIQGGKYIRTNSKKPHKGSIGLEQNETILKLKTNKICLD